MSQVILRNFKKPKEPYGTLGNPKELQQNQKNVRKRQKTQKFSKGPVKEEEEKSFLHCKYFCCIIYDFLL